MHTSAPPTRTLVYWLFSGALLILAMVVIGGITRLTGSGLSIVEWNVISGTLPPLTQAAWQVAFEKYQQFPEFQKVNFSMTLVDFKQIFWWEYLHRLLGRVIGLVFIVPFMFWLVRGQLSGRLLKRLLFILFLGMCQGAMGWLMVKSGLVDNPHVSHYRLAAHLCLALALISTILWTIGDLTFKHQRSSHSDLCFLRSAKGLLAFLFLQIVLGAFVAGLKAGFYYNTFPLMNGEVYPSVLHEVLTWQNFMENGSLMQFVHRWVGVGVLGLLFRFWLKSSRPAIPLKTKRLALILLSLGLVQVVLGIATLLLQVPVLLGVLHQVVAFVLFSCGVVLVHQLQRAYQVPAMLAHQPEKVPALR
ncbi:COX15/CtaA family protein [Rufibacter sediminis]|uniref:COX15/CtaA family protein n=1 Tax=Rufibacter sediminis TaxID=2762756 RepID=A0ABR6VNT2_9BACT|nr:COX15/CtaA family protein [Rufibacter sediminis]MBC3538844.1 COX15/CtaA family protein [Rufibacter sediminis]